MDKNEASLVNDIVFKEEPMVIIKKIFLKPDERPEKDRWICAYYHGEFYFDLLYEKERISSWNNEVIPERATGSDGCDLLWKNIDYWCYMKDIKNILKTIMKQENCDGVD